MTTLETLKAARKSIENPERWTQGAFRSNGARCAASALCNTGADMHSYTAAYTIMCDQVGKSLIDFNDTHTHAEVLAAFDAAIAKLEKP